METMETKYSYTADWFLRSELRILCPKVLDKNKKLRILEIGSYEGLSACFFSDNFLNHPESHMDCVDPFDLGDTTTPLTSITKTFFSDNISKSTNSVKVTLHEKYSKDFFKWYDSEPYDFIYIDGSHLPDDIIHDMVQSFAMLKSGGIMWMDDYLFGTPPDDTVRRTMNYVLSDRLSPDSFEVIHAGYQLAIRKK